MFLNENDYKSIVSAGKLDLLQQSDETARERAELMAIEEISGYLRPRYDVTAIFEATGDDRNKLLVMYTMDVTLFHLMSWLPNRMGAETRKERYDRAIEWLSDVQKGKVIPDLPLFTDPDTGSTDAANPIRWGSVEKSQYDY